MVFQWYFIVYHIHPAVVYYKLSSPFRTAPNSVTLIFGLFRNPHSLPRDGPLCLKIMQLLLAVHVKIVFISGLFVRKLWVRMLQPWRFQHPSWEQKWRIFYLLFCYMLKLSISFCLLLVGHAKRELMLRRPLGYTATDIYNVRNFHLNLMFFTLHVSCHSVLLYEGFWCSPIKKCVGHVWIAQHTTWHWQEYFEIHSQEVAMCFFSMTSCLFL